jgi:hypothetical protein
VLPKLTTAEAFQEAFLHQEYAILGIDLVPFSFRHYLLLQAYGSPILSGGPIGADDVMAFVVACSCWSDREFWRAIRRQGERVPGDTWADWWLRGLLIDPKETVPIITAYLADYFPSFPFWEKNEDSENRIPGLYICAARVLAAVGRQETMQMPIGEMLAWSLALCEAQGNRIDTLMSEADVEALKSIEAEENSRG